ncbi:MAG: HDIG domain-containing metalloprotein [Thermomicrobiales bacterium]
MSDVPYPDLNGKTREETWELLNEWVKSPSLIRHCLAVETAMRAYARKNGEPEEAWSVVGLIHDFDYEKHPTLDEHPYVGAGVLRGLGYPDWVVAAVLSHADDPAHPRTTQLEKTLFAVDELTGFISAVALVRPSKAVADVKASSVRKKMKDKAFAAAVKREDLIAGAEELGIDLDEHITFVIGAMTENAEALGLGGVSDPA